MEANRDAAGFSNKQRSGLAARRADHDRTLEAMHRLEAAFGEAAPGREEPWRNEVLEALSVLEERVHAQPSKRRRSGAPIGSI
jgi:hypothetical protein